jgi:hypothetical protein
VTLLLGRTVRIVVTIVRRRELGVVGGGDGDSGNGGGADGSGGDGGGGDGGGGNTGGKPGDGDGQYDGE